MFGTLTNALLGLTFGALCLNLAPPALRFLSKQRLDMSAGKPYPNQLERILDTYGKSLGFAQIGGGEMANLAVKLDACFSRIPDPKKAFKGKPNDIRIIKKAHRALRDLVAKQRKHFNRAYNSVCVIAPAILAEKKKGKAKGFIDGQIRGLIAGTDALVPATLEELFGDLENLILMLIRGVLIQLYGPYCLEPQNVKKHLRNPAFAKAYKRCEEIRWRVFGILGKELPALVSQILSDKGVFPMVKQILLENQSQLARTKAAEKGAPGWAVTVAGSVLDMQKKLVQPLVDGMINSGMAGLNKTVRQFGARWRKKSDLVKNRLADKQYWNISEPFETKAAVVSKVRKAIKQESAPPNVSKKPQSMDSPETSFGVSELKMTIHSLEETIILMKFVIAGLAIFLLFSWAYICFILSMKDEEAPARERRKSSFVDLEKGDSKSTKSRKRRKSEHDLDKWRKRRRTARRNKKQLLDSDESDAGRNSRQGKRSRQSPAREEVMDYGPPSIG